MGVIEVLNLVQPKLSHAHPDSSGTGRLKRASGRRDGDWWYNPVVAEPEPARLFPFYENLAEIEEDLEEMNDLKVMFVPCSDE